MRRIRQPPVRGEFDKDTLDERNNRDRAPIVGHGQFEIGPRGIGRIVGLVRIQLILLWVVFSRHSL